MSSIPEQLELDRKSLLDLTLRNNLLNFRLTKARGVEILDEISDELYRILVVDGKSMDFLPVTEVDDDLVLKKTSYFQEQCFHPGLSAEELAFQTCEIVSYAEAAAAPAQPVDEAEQDPGRHTDSHLQTPYSDYELQKRLLETSAASREYIEEKGVNVLYLALGELQWSQSDSEERILRAPLIFVPLEIARKSIDSRFMIRYSASGVSDNPALREKLKLDFRLVVPHLLSEDGDETDIKPSDYFQKLAETIALNPDWVIDPNAINIALFSFNKLLMFKDLDSGQWPVTDQPENHPVIQRLLATGFSSTVSAGDLTSSREAIDQYLTVNRNNHIVDADSTQAQAIQAVSRGNTIAIQGPPGTGKSQTIANIIAEAVGNGRTVLFVAEKLAALEVVKRRLEKVGIGDLCLELHSSKANRKAVINELNRTRSLGRPTPADSEPLQSMETIRASLNAYSDAVNTPIGQSTVTPYRAFGELIRLSKKRSGQNWPSWTCQSAARWTQQEFQDKRVLVRIWLDTIKEHGDPLDNVFWGSELTATAPNTADEVRWLSRKAVDALEDLSRSAVEFANVLNIGDSADRVGDLLDIVRLGTALTILVRYPDTCLNPNEWSHYALVVDDIDDAVQGLLKTASVQKHVLEVDDFAASDFDQIVSVVKQYPPGPFNFLNRKLRTAKQKLSRLISDLPSDYFKLQELLDELLVFHRALRRLQIVRREGAYLLGEAWKLLIPEPSTVLEITHAGKLLRRASNRLPDLTDAMSSQRVVQTILDNRLHVENMSNLADDFNSSVHDLFERIKFRVSKRFAFDSIDQCKTADFLRILSDWIVSANQISDLVSVNMATSALLRADLNTFVVTLEGWSTAQQYALDLFDYAYFDALINFALETRPALAEFQRLAHEAKLEKFRALDKQLLNYNRSRTLAAHFQGSQSNSSIGQAGILLSELAKQRRFRTIRRLIADAYDPILKLKPIFMMSPLSVANYLQPGTIQFDLVIFDEASQIRPADAYGAILRGKQVVVVGDSRQLPPTSFFDGTVDQDEDEAASNYESILGKFNSQGVPNHMLRWHYRSAHETLIAVSNQEYYENRLLLAPSPQHISDELGLKYRHLAETYYQPGAAVNQGEADAVALAVMEHARNHPELSLGVAAFSIKQKEVIRDVVERLRSEDTSTEAFFTKDTDEPFFIKNLENVQGDERDVIFISIGYGKTRDGKVLQNFGPLNRDGGERRLNVLITRARLRCEVFTNLSADDLNLTESSSRGLLGLKRYLKYAETGVLDLPVGSGRGPDSVFEEMVADQLRNAGYEVHHQVGTAGFFVDLAVVDPVKSGNYLLGIECDGASYHSSASARDRDRLRQAILESKGWHIHRIWSTDWFRNSARETERVIEAIERFRGVPQVLEVSTKAASLDVAPLREATQSVPSNSLLSPGIVFPPYVESQRPNFANKWYVSIDEVRSDLIMLAIQHVITIEAPIHIDLLTRRVASFFIQGNVTKRVKNRIENSIHIANLQRNGDYLSQNGEVRLRSRANLSSASRRQELVADSELNVGCLEVIRQCQPVLSEEVQKQLWYALGFERVSAEMKTRTEGHILHLLRRGQINARNEYLSITKS